MYVSHALDWGVAFRANDQTSELQSNFAGVRLFVFFLY